MNNQGFSDYIVYKEAVCQKYAHGVTVTAEQRRQITGMMRMFARAGIVVCAGQRKRGIGMRHTVVLHRRCIVLRVAVPWLNQRRTHAGISVVQMEAEDAAVALPLLF